MQQAEHNQKRGHSDAWCLFMMPLFGRILTVVLEVLRACDDAFRERTARKRRRNNGSMQKKKRKKKRTTLDIA